MSKDERAKLVFALSLVVIGLALVLAPSESIRLIHSTLGGAAVSGLAFLIGGLLLGGPASAAEFLAKQKVDLAILEIERETRLAQGGALSHPDVDGSIAGQLSPARSGEGLLGLAERR